MDMKKPMNKDETQQELAEILGRFGLVVTAFEKDGTVIVADGSSQDEEHRAIN